MRAVRARIQLKLKVLQIPPIYIAPIVSKSMALLYAIAVFLFIVMFTPSSKWMQRLKMKQCRHQAPFNTITTTYIYIHIQYTNDIKSYQWWQKWSNMFSLNREDANGMTETSWHVWTSHSCVNVEWSTPDAPPKSIREKIYHDNFLWQCQWLLYFTEKSRLNIFSNFCLSDSWSWSSSSAKFITSRWRLSAKPSTTTSAQNPITFLRPMWLARNHSPFQRASQVPCSNMCYPPESLLNRSAHRWRQTSCGCAYVRLVYLVCRSIRVVRDMVVILGGYPRGMPWNVCVCVIVDRMRLVGCAVLIF